MVQPSRAWKGCRLHHNQKISKLGPGIVVGAGISLSIEERSSSSSLGAFVVLEDTLDRLECEVDASSNDPFATETSDSCVLGC